MDGAEQVPTGIVDAPDGVQVAHCEGRPVQLGEGYPVPEAGAGARQGLQLRVGGRHVRPPVLAAHPAAVVAVFRAEQARPVEVIAWKSPC